MSSSIQEVKSLEMVAAFLRINTKYVIQQLRVQDLKLLSLRYTSHICNLRAAEHRFSDAPRISDLLVDHIRFANLAE